MYFLENWPGEPWPESVTDNIRLIQKNDRVYLKLYFERSGEAGSVPVPKFWKVIEKDGEERKRRIYDTESLNWKKIEGEIVFLISNIFTKKQEPKSIICVAKEILVRDIIKNEESYFSYETDEEDDEY